MIARPSHKPGLEDVLDELAGLDGPPDAATLRRWTERYPEFAREIVGFTTDWVAMDAARAAHVVSAEEVDLVVNRTMSRVQTMLDAGEQPSALTDLAAEIHDTGKDLDAFQRQLGIDRSILDSLIKRLAKPSTMPTCLIRSIADSLNRSMSQVRDYFRLPPLLAGAHKSRARPAPMQVEFSMLVRYSSLPEPDKNRWLVEPVDPELQDGTHG